MRSYDRTWADIDLDAIYGNIERTRKIVDPHAGILAVVKADAYGHGAVPVAKTLDPLVCGFAVAIPEEGEELRRAGIRKPILILGYVPESQNESCIRASLTETVFGYEMAEAISRTAQACGTTAEVHIKVDTGMSRIGFRPDHESALEVRRIAALPGIRITGMFTHFACADMMDKASAREQYRRYAAFAEELEKLGIHIPVKHVANSAAIIDLPEYDLDMVRSGITTYGLYPSEEVNKARLPLEPALSWKAKIVFVKEVPAGVGIGYGSTFVTMRPTRVATISAGYADGYPRSLSNRGRVLIHGHSCPILGRVCMDQFMVDVSGIPDAKTGDTAVLIGKDGTEEISAEEFGAVAGSFNYEVVCDISGRVPRVYHRGGRIVGTMEHFHDYPNDFEEAVQGQA